MSSRLTLDDSDSVPDPTDFPPSDIAPGLRELDEALRCSICGELFEAPLTVSCGHCFCSLCIRTQLHVKPECPLCRKSTSEFYLRKAQTVEDAVKAWKLARPYILRLCQAELKRKTQFLRGKSVDHEIEMRSPKKRKRNASPMDDDIVEIVKPPSSKGKTQRSGLSPPLASRSSSEGPQIVGCPVCQRQVPFSKINRHLDEGCRSPSPTDFQVGSSSAAKGKQKQDWQKLFSSGDSPASKTKGKVKTSKTKVKDDALPIPKVAYHTLKDKRLREMLAKYDLPTTGDKDALARRHERWVLMYNANLDRSLQDRQTLDDLRRELKRWEADRQARKQAVTDLHAYHKANKAVFEELIEAARPRKTMSATPGPISSSEQKQHLVETEVPASSSPAVSTSSTGDPDTTVLDDR